MVIISFSSACRHSRKWGDLSAPSRSMGHPLPTLAFQSNKGGDEASTLVVAALYSKVRLGTTPRRGRPSRKRSPMSPTDFLLKRVLPLVLGAALVALVAPSAAAANDPHIRPGQSWDAVLSKASAGSVVRVASGRHPYQVLRGNYRGIRLVGVSRKGSVVRGVNVNGARNLTLRNFTTRPTREVPGVRISHGSWNVVVDDVTATMRVGQAGFDIARVGRAAPRRIALTNVRYRGWRSRGKYARGVRIFAGGVPRDRWPSNIILDGADLGGAAADLVQIGGGRNVTIRDCVLDGLQSNSQHNDGIQSYGSDGLRVIRTKITAPGAYEGPDQGIMLKHGNGGYLRVRDTVIRDSTVRDFRGQGISLAGTLSSVVRGNTVKNMSYPGSSLVLAGTNAGLVLEDNQLDKVYRVGASPQ